MRSSRGEKESQRPLALKGSNRGIQPHRPAPRCHWLPPPANVDEEFPWLVFGLMPLRRLASPLLRVCARSREVTLSHYGTRVDIYEMQPSTKRYGLDNLLPYEQWRK
ncbi:hypothetical protein PG996_000084 [Apiospora saccharicola]|uniref:Uncharacterized protein n=1 Tax=Apiospora saccharicola TaxID=335842 RepID=A0ABR1WGT9_9PEZI